VAYELSLLAKAESEKVFTTRSLHFLDISTISSGFMETIREIDFEKSDRLLHKKPVCVCRTDSLGPPLFQAITGVPTAIASHGTIPKCSPWGE
jgi:hypothetical protein